MTMTTLPPTMVVQTSDDADGRPEPVPYADRLTPVRTSWPMPPLSVGEPAGYRRAWLLVGLLVTALFAAVVFRFYAPADSGVDQNAYLLGGRLLAETGSMRYVLPNPYAYTGGMMVRMPSGVDDLFRDHNQPLPPTAYYPKYPAGLPLLYAAVFKLLGPERGPVWAFAVSPASAVAAVLGTFLLARLVAGSFAAVMAAVLLGCSQVMLSLADNPNSHAACAAVIVWGMYFLVRWWRSGHVLTGVAAGFLIGYAYTIRYTEILLVLPVTLACLTRVRWRHWSAFALAGSVAAFAAAFLTFVVLWTDGSADGLRGLQYWFGPGRRLGSTVLLLTYAAGGAGLVTVAWLTVRRAVPAAWVAGFVRNIVPGLAWCVPVVALAVHNSAAMRHATGYDTTNESKLGVAFKWAYFAKNWEMVLRTFDGLELYFVIPFAIAGLALVFRRNWRVGLLLLGWLVPGVVLYTSYYWSMNFDVAYARFYLTFLPALCVAAAVAFHDGLLGGAASATARAGRPWSTIVQVLAASACVAAVVLLLQAHYGGGWDTGPTAGRGWGRWAGSGRAIAAAGGAGLLLAAAIAAVATAWRGGFNRVSWSADAARVPAMLAIGAVVAISASVSVYRSLKGLRDGDQNMIPIAENYRTRLNLAVVGEHLLHDVPAGSILLSGGGGGIASPSNYIQFLRSWELYTADAFNETGARRGFGGGGGGNRNRRDNNGGGRGGFMGFGGRGGGPGGPGGGGPGGGPPGMGGPGNGGNNDDTTDQASATPIQAEQQEFHAGLYKNKSRGQLYQMQAALFRQAFVEHRRVFVVIDREGMDGFEDALNGSDMTRYTKTKYTFKTVAAWSDVATPIDRDEESKPADNNRWGGGGNRGRRGGGGGGAFNGMGRLFGVSDTQTDWELAEILPVTPKGAKPTAEPRPAARFSAAGRRPA